MSYMTSMTSYFPYTHKDKITTECVHFKIVKKIQQIT